MSYDLFFYKQKDKEISTDKISDYLSNNLVAANEGNTQWFFENKDTEVYFSFDYNEPDADNQPEEEDITPIDDFDDTNFSFNLNFMRPAFFGTEAFKFVEKFCADLGLFVLNPQADSDPYKPNAHEEISIWNKTNLWASKDHFDPMQTCYLSEEECYKVWEYNFNRRQLQEKLGDGYFVPKIFFFKKKQNNEPFTLTIWTEHLPIVLPATDYILLTRQYKKFFRNIKDTVLVSREKLLNEFGNYFVEFDFPDCKIIHPNNANQAKNKFNAIKPEKELAEFAERLAVENLFNAKPD
jgi:hypothetical protein